MKEVYIIVPVVARKLENQPVRYQHVVSYLAGRQILLLGKHRDSRIMGILSFKRIFTP
jgi:hypothetical protein